MSEPPFKVPRRRKNQQAAPPPTEVPLQDQQELQQTVRKLDEILQRNPVLLQELQRPAQQTQPAPQQQKLKQPASHAQKPLPLLQLEDRMDDAQQSRSSAAWTQEGKVITASPGWLLGRFVRKRKSAPTPAPALHTVEAVRAEFYASRAARKAREAAQAAANMRGA
ncbi:unnamed protein product [Effrenium voratum]|nr:unnamed protein product [Effrenium voratum]